MLSNLLIMAKKKSFYENEYTKQLEEAVFDQKGYDERKLEAKKKVIAENQRQKQLVRVALSLLGLALMVGIWRLPTQPENLRLYATLFVCAVTVLGWMAKRLFNWINK